jgi:hypothetical protein
MGFALILGFMVQVDHDCRPDGMGPRTLSMVIGVVIVSLIYGPLVIIYAAKYPGMRGDEFVVADCIVHCIGKKDQEYWEQWLRRDLGNTSCDKYVEDRTRRVSRIVIGLSVVFFVADFAWLLKFFIGTCGKWEKITDTTLLESLRERPALD